ncbi:G-type lectin S-receptor-like serine/threonine-protein kinase [Vitis vinifera]|uniref:non-specific serine/threonine protein kinase n=1 Tax=Vitis vinifera TaxID=29760 RepID=A0A438CFB9_VITVI|nr:G-type lectin S-receptor-like serine/threonine-protein kinase [Vitis vinifera]
MHLSIGVDTIFPGQPISGNQTITSQDERFELVLEDSGNLVLRSWSNSSVVLWQSFDHPTDTWLPGGKLGLNKLTKKQQIYSSWSSYDDPAPGPFLLKLDPNGTRQYFIMWNGDKHWTCGIWPGRVSVFGPDMLDDNYNNMTYVSNEEENYFTYSVTKTSILSRFVMDSSGQLRQLTWLEDSQQWNLIWSRPKQQCEIYALWGNMVAAISSVFPHCRKGGKDGFRMIPNIRLPANAVSLTVRSSKECEAACLENCTCTAYTFDGECSIWLENLLNIQYLSFGDNLGKDLHLRVAAVELVVYRSRTKPRINGDIVGAAAGVATLTVILGFIIWKCRRRQFSSAVKPTEDLLVLYKYSDLRKATKNFSEKLGEGGFGSVFKGTLPNSAEIAAKKLKCHGQGEKQFRTEVSTIGTIHHINLIRLRGFCLEGTKRFLVYEYMPNGSLESHLFQKSPRILDWKTRCQIALGIARGLEYLHEKCRDCIIHCDIKPENILLDAGYNPKISDFGLAKLIGRDFSRVLTTVKGTRGYLAPEWISGIAITAKADVFSYGMMLFEIISGRRNWEIKDDRMNDYFPAQVMKKLSRGEELLTLLDEKLEQNADIEELTRVCKVACWCIQDDEGDRPSMKSVVQILEGALDVIMPPIPSFIENIAENPEEGSPTPGF